MIKQQHSSLRWIWAAAFAFVLSLGSTSFGQGVTTSGISGFVTDASGKAVPGASIVVVQDATGSRAVATTRATGQFNVEGLTPGGPYTVTATGGSLTGPVERKDVYINLGVENSVDLAAQSDVVHMEAFSVSESGTQTTFDASNMGTGSTYSAKQIKEIASVRRDLQDFENLDPRAVMQQVSPSDPAFTFSIAGQNPRENAILVDGVSAADNFGLNSNGYAGLRNPIPPEWVSTMSLDINPYDVVYSGFLGGLLDVSLKSGTNDFHGSYYNIYTGTNFRGPDPVVSVLGKHEPTQQHTNGGTFSGPLWKDRIFFFVGYDAFRQIAAAPAQLFNPLYNAAGQAQIAEITQKLESGIALGGVDYKYNPGDLNAISHTWEQNFVAKLDFNISDSQKFSVTFRHTIGDAPVFYNYTGTAETSFDTSWYNSNRSDQSWTAQLNSDWSKYIDNFHTEIEGTYKRYNGTATLDGPKLPAITIEGLTGYEVQNNSVTSTGGEVFTGTYWAYQDNNIYTWEQEEHAFGTYSWGNHNFKFGAQFDRTGYTDTFIPNIIGSYSFYTVQNFLNTTINSSTVETPAKGYTLGEDVSHYYLLDIEPMIQDSWKPNDQLTLLAGVRMDYPYEPQDPLFSPVFYKAYGYSNTSTIDGNYVVSPRVGFNYQFKDKWVTQLRGGGGLFLGQNPVVWLENSFNNAGQLNTVTNGVASAAAPSIDYTDRNFHWPSSWKENVAIDQNLPWHMIATVEADFSQVNKDVFYQETNPYARPTSGPLVTPDGAQRYAGVITPGTSTSIGTAYYQPSAPTGYYSALTNSPTTLYQNHGTAAVYELTNTSKGESSEYTVELSRPMIGGFAWSLAYTRTHATQVDPFTSSVAGSGFTSQPIINPNDNIAYRSNYDVPNKFVATATKQFNFMKVKHATTSIAAQFITETGQPFSWVFKGDADGSGITGEDLFYVPVGPNDPKVEWLSSTEETKFFKWLSGTPDLAKWRGKIAPRNAGNAGEQSTVNLHLEQELPLFFRDARVTLFADCFNFANLLDHKMGIVDNFNNNFVTQTVAGTGYDTKTNKYIYTFNPGTLGLPTTYSDESRWQIQIGAKLEF